jgi:hypothetical protein
VEVNFIPQQIYLWEGTLLPIMYAGWVPEPKLMFWRREKSLAPARIQTSCCQGCNLVFFPYTLSWLLKSFIKVIFGYFFKIIQTFEIAVVSGDSTAFVL